MDNLSKRFNEMLMQEMGFDIGTDGKLIDQDVGVPITFEGIPVVAPGIMIQRGDSSVVPFDPYNNSRMMNQMFNHFIHKLTDMGEIDNYDVVFNQDIPGVEGGVITIRSETDEISSSKPYLRESCKYADLVFQLNDNEVPDMKDFDIPKAKQKELIKKQISKKAKSNQKKVKK